MIYTLVSITNKESIEKYHSVFAIIPTKESNVLRASEAWYHKAEGLVSVWRLREK